jgi:NarL family two-component system response regulator LiaR
MEFPVVASAKSAVLLVTAQSLFRECLKSAICSNVSKVDIQTAETAEQAYVLCEQSRDLLVVFDVDGLPAFTPAETREFTQRFAGTTVLIVGRCKHEDDAISYLEAGATDFRVADWESLEQFCKVIESALRGEIDHGPERTRAIFARLRQLSAEVSRMNAIDSMVLTDRELEILKLVDEGRSNKHIAKALHISLHTVKNHVHRILEKLQVSNRREAVHFAYSNGWLRIGTY